MHIDKLQQNLENGKNPYIDVTNQKDLVLHLVEETGELVKAFRHFRGVVVEPYFSQALGKVAEELGDVLILLCFTASGFGISLEDATLQKIKKNIREGKFKPSLHDGLKNIEGLFDDH